MKQYNGTYLGIVVQNNDPEFRGRVKVWVPHISTVLYDRWNKLKKDKKFKFPGQNILSDLSADILDDLKAVLPWSEYCAPNIGATGSGRYNAQNDNATISDSNNITATQPGTDSTSAYQKYKLNKDIIGEKAGRVYEAIDSRVSDAFVDTAANKTKQANKYGNVYAPPTYSNAAKGTFSIPNVGSHIWVFFREGNPMYPVYIGASFGQDDFKSIYNAAGDAYQDYPQTFESKSKHDNPNPDFNSDVYRNKFVFSQKGGVIEIINTDGREAFNLAHYGGSYLGFNNKTTTLFSTKNYQALTLGDTFETFRGFKNSFVEKDYDFLVQGDHFIKIGNLNTSAFDAWIDVYTDIHNLKKLFEIRRVEQDGSFATISHLGNNVQSFSTQDGTWNTQTSKNQIAALIQSKTAQLAAIEAQMGRGGNEVTTITKHKIEMIGLVLNTFDSIRVDSIGKLSDYATTITSTGVYAEKAATPLVEYVDAENFPSGTYTHYIANKYRCIIGSGGYELKTTGPIDINGTIVNITGNQVNIAAKNELTIDGGKRLNLVADVLTLAQRADKQVNIVSNFGVSKNTVVRGGLHVEGELSFQHLTAPVEWHVTEPTHIKTTFTITNVNIPALTQADGANKPITAPSMTGTIELDTDHTHYHRGPAMSLLADVSSVRTDASSKVNSDSASPRGYKAILDGKKGGGAMRPAQVVNGPNNNDYGDGTNTSD